MENNLDKNLLEGQELETIKNLKLFDLNKKVTYEDILKIEIDKLRNQEKREDYSLIGHTDYVKTVAFSPDGKLLASGSGNSEIKVWDLLQREEVYKLTGHSETIASLVFSPDGRFLASGSIDKTIKIWNLQQEREEYSLIGHNSRIKAVSFSPDGNYLASASADNLIKIWNMIERQEEYSLPGHKDPVATVAFSPDGKLLASGSDDRMVKVWNLLEKREEYTITGHTDYVSSVDFAQDGNLLASGSYDKTIKIWNLIEKKEECLLTGHKNCIKAVAFSPNSKYLASGSSDNTIKIWNVIEKKLEFTLTGHESRVQTIAFNKKDKTEDYLFTGHGNVTRCVRFSPDGKLLASGSYDKTIKLWDILEKRLEHTFAGHTDYVTSIAFTPDSKFLVSGSEDFSIKIWNISKKQEECSLYGHNNVVATIAVSPQGKLLASGSEDFTIKIWNLEEITEEYTLTGHDNIVRSIEFSPDGKYILSGSYDKTIKIWNVSEKRLERSFSGHDDEVISVAFSPDAIHAASGSYDKTINVWNLIECRKEFSLTGHDSFVISIDFNHTGRHLVSGSDDNMIKIWNLLERREEFTLTGHTEYIASVKFSPDGTLLASGSRDKTVRVWRILEQEEKLGLNQDQFLNNFIDKNETKCTQDLKYRLYYKNNCLKLFRQSKIKSEYTKVDYIGPKNTFDTYYQKKNLFYNFLDGLKDLKFEDISVCANNLVFTQYLFSSLHLLCYLGKLETLNKLLNETSVIKVDLFGKSPLYYCIKRKFSECLDSLLIHLTSLLSSEKVFESLRIKSSLYAIRNDFGMIFEKSSIYLVPFLEQLLVNSDIVFAKLEDKFPIIRYSQIAEPIIDEFINFKPEAEEIPVILQTTLFPLESSLDSQNTIEFIEKVIKCKNKTIFRTPVIQCYIKFHWDNLIMWIGFYSILAFLNMGFFLFNLLTSDYKICALVLFLISNLFFIIWELLQFRGEGLEYFKDTHNILDLPRVITTVTWILMEFTASDLKQYYLYDVFTLIIASLNFIRSFTGFCLFDNTRYYIRLIPKL